MFRLDDDWLSDLRKWQNWLYKLAEPVLTAVYAESQRWSLSRSVLRENSSKMPFCCKSTWPSPVVSLPLASSLLSTVSEGCTSTLEKQGSLSTGDRKRVASIASLALTLKPWNSTLLLVVATFLPVLVTLGKVPHRSYRGNSHVHGFSVDESSA